MNAAETLDDYTLLSLGLRGCFKSNLGLPVCYFCFCGTISWNIVYDVYMYINKYRISTT